MGSEGNPGPVRWWDAACGYEGSQLVTGAPLGVTVVGGMAVGNSKATVDAGTVLRQARQDHG